MKIAAVNWKLRPDSSIEGFFTHVEELLVQCEGADVVVMPELPCLECLDLEAGVEMPTMPGSLADLFEPEWHRFASLAAQYSCTLVAGSYFRRTGHGVVNTAVVARPDGNLCLDIPKVVMTQFEAVDWGITPGQGLRELPGQLGVTVCYDSEFPEAGRVLAESGVLVQCVPSYTETRHGFTRVRGSCLARAIENQIVVVHSSLVGSLSREPVPNAVGSSAILVPPVDPFPHDGILVETASDEEAVAIAEIDLADLHYARNQGDVRNWNDRHTGDWSLEAATWSE